MRIYHFTILFFSIIIFNYFSLCPVSLVYNIRVRRAFNTPRVVKQRKPRTLFSSIPIGLTRRGSVDIEDIDRPVIIQMRRAAGVLFNARYVPSKEYWVDVTTGILKDSEENILFSDSRTGFDDIVITGGFRNFYDRNTQFIGYGLVGLPTRLKVEKTDEFGPLVGTRFFNIGVGAEASYSFINDYKTSLSLIGQGRIIHGFERSWYPILPRDRTIDPGMFSDVLCAVQYRDRYTVYQAGYDLTVFSGQAINTEKVRYITKTFTRNSWYGTVGKAVLNGFFEKPTLFGAGLSISKSQVFNARAIIGWLFLTQVF